jgi:YHS domain-containing protein
MEKLNGVSYLERDRERRGHCNHMQPKEPIHQQEERMTTDPVCEMKVDERESEFQTQFAGKKYFFCSEDCKREFEERPDEYLEIAA